MRLPTFLLALLIMAAPQITRAQQQNLILVELFTSQGCSACPPADALLPELDEMPGVLALAFHVDYWNYLGWKDTFSSPQNSARQKAYSHALHKRSIYTPQVIVHGREAIVGHKGRKIADALQRHMQASPRIMMEASRDGGILVVRIEPVDGPRPGAVDISVVRYMPSQEVEIRHGENAGRSFTYHNIVSDWDVVARWDGREPVDLRFEGLGDEPVAVIAQEADMGPVLSAARLP